MSGIVNEAKLIASLDKEPISLESALFEGIDGVEHCNATNFAYQFETNRCILYFDQPASYQQINNMLTYYGSSSTIDSFSTFGKGIRFLFHKTKAHIEIISEYNDEIINASFDSKKIIEGAYACHIINETEEGFTKFRNIVSTNRTGPFINKVNGRPLSDVYEEDVNATGIAKNLIMKSDDGIPFKKKMIILLKNLGDNEEYQGLITNEARWKKFITNMQTRYSQLIKNNSLTIYYRNNGFSNQNAFNKLSLLDPIGFNELKKAHLHFKIYSSTDKKNIYAISNTKTINLELNTPHRRIINDLDLSNLIHVFNIDFFICDSSISEQFKNGEDYAGVYSLNNGFMPSYCSINTASGIFQVKRNNPGSSKFRCVITNIKDKDASLSKEYFPYSPDKSVTEIKDTNVIGNILRKLRCIYESGWDKDHLILYPLDDAHWQWEVLPTSEKKKRSKKDPDAEVTRTGVYYLCILGKKDNKYLIKAGITQQKKKEARINDHYTPDKLKEYRDRYGVTTTYDYTMLRRLYENVNNIKEFEEKIKSYCNENIENCIASVNGGDIREYIFVTKEELYNLEKYIDIAIEQYGVLI